MIGLDTSILVARSIAEHPQHEASHQWLDGAITRNQTFAITSGILAEFIHIVTDGRRFETPLSISEALERAAFWGEAREVTLLSADDVVNALWLKWLTASRMDCSSIARRSNSDSSIWGFRRAIDNMALTASSKFRADSGSNEGSVFSISMVRLFMHATIAKSCVDAIRFPVRKSGWSIFIQPLTPRKPSSPARSAWAGRWRSPRSSPAPTRSRWIPRSRFPWRRTSPRGRFPLGWSKPAACS